MRRRLLLAGLLLGALACTPERERPRNVLLLSLDTVRADHLGAYGRADAGTPSFDALAALGTRFADAMAPSPITLPSHASLLTGLSPLRHGVRHNGLFALSSEVVTLAERLREAGFRTGAFVASVVLAPQHGLYQGFETYSAPGLGHSPGLFFLGQRAALEINRQALGWLDSIGDGPFFLFVHYMEAHAPYSPPEPERSRFPDDPYQGEIAAADRAFGQLLAGLKARGRLARTLVFVVADHGEALGDHGELSHGIFLYQSTLHVPMLAAGPGVRAGQVVEQPVGLVDVAPTLLEALGLPPTAPADGRSLWPALAGSPPPALRELYAETFVPRYDYGWSELRALRRGPYKFILAPRPELYLLTGDPQEAHNRIPGDFRADYLASALTARAMQDQARGQQSERVALSSEQRGALAALGYLLGWHGDDDAATPDPKDRVADAVAMEQAAGLLREERYDRAERLLRGLVAANPLFLEARIRLILTLVLAGESEAAVAEGQELAEAARQVPEGELTAARGHLLLAQMHLNAGKLEPAAREYERALLAPQPPEIHITLAAIYHDLGRTDDAIRVLRALAERGEANPRARQILRVLEGARASAESPGASDGAAAAVSPAGSGR